jgi:hypothetical protein
MAALINNSVDLISKTSAGETRRVEAPISLANLPPAIHGSSAEFGTTESVSAAPWTSAANAVMKKTRLNLRNDFPDDLKSTLRFE